MALINEIINPQGFEVVENRIAEILTIELENQHCLQKLESDFQVWVERQEPFDKSEDVMISVILFQGEYEGKNQRDLQGEYLYFIDIALTGEGSVDESPSINARNKLFKYAGMVRYILESGKYNLLGFPPGLIGGKSVKRITFDTDFSNFGNHSNYDGAFIRFCRIIFSVRVQENQLLWDAVALEGNDSKITYETSSKGTQLIFNN